MLTIAKERPKSLTPLTNKDGLNGFFFDSSSGEIWDGELNRPILSLPSKQAFIFELLVQHPNETMSILEIVHVIDPLDIIPYEEDVRISTNIQRIRRNLERIKPELSLRLQNIRGFGYRWIDITNPRSSVNLT